MKINYALLLLKPSGFTGGPRTYLYIHMLCILLSAHYQPYAEPENEFLHWTNAGFTTANQGLTRIRS